MKKIVALFAIAAITSCGSGTESTPTTTDSTKVCADSTVCKDSTKCCTDSTKVVDSTKAEEIK